MKTVMVFGTFDFIHAGHLFLFEQARKHGDYLLVVVARDETAQRVKANAPIHSEKERAHILQHIDLIDEVLLGDKKDMYKVIRDKKPDVIALGYDQVAFVDGVEACVSKNDLQTNVVRLREYAQPRKSTQIKKAFGI